MPRCHAPCRVLPDLSRGRRSCPGRSARAARSWGIGPNQAPRSQAAGTRTRCRSSSAPPSRAVVLREWDRRKRCARGRSDAAGSGRSTTQHRVVEAPDVERASREQRPGIPSQGRMLPRRRAHPRVGISARSFTQGLAQGTFLLDQPSLMDRTPVRAGRDRRVVGDDDRRLAALAVEAPERNRRRTSMERAPEPRELPVGSSAGPTGQVGPRTTLGLLVVLSGRTTGSPSRSRSE